MVDLTNVISWVDLFEVDVQRREEEVLFKGGVSGTGRYWQESLGDGQEVTWRVLSKQADQSGDRQCGRRDSSHPHRRHRHSFPLECVWDSRELVYFYHLPCQPRDTSCYHRGLGGGNLHPSWSAG